MTTIQLNPTAKRTLDVLPVRSFTDTVVAGALATDRCLSMGFTARASREVGIAAAELASNIVRHAGQGELEMDVDGDRAVLTATDHGPGIDDPRAALRDHFSRGRLRESPDEPLLSLGCGLGAVKRLMSTLEIEQPPGGGTVVRATKFREPNLTWW